MQINKKIFSIRQQRVMLDVDLAELYEVETKTLNRSVRRNKIRFPEDFMFQLTEKELELELNQTTNRECFYSRLKLFQLGHLIELPLRLIGRDSLGLEHHSLSQSLSMFSEKR
jgi:hypothetical protein